MWTYLNHGWRKGHQININRYATELAKGNGKGWLMKCECGKEWAR